MPAYIQVGKSKISSQHKAGCFYSVKCEGGELSIEVVAVLFGVNGEMNHWSTYLISILQR